jgi:hypothetical protein
MINEGWESINVSGSKHPYMPTRCHKASHDLHDASLSQTIDVKLDERSLKDQEPRRLVKVETHIHDNLRELVTWECKEHGVKS